MLHSPASALSMRTGSGYVRTKAFPLTPNAGNAVPAFTRIALHPIKQAPKEARQSRHSGVCKFEPDTRSGRSTVHANTADSQVARAAQQLRTHGWAVIEGVLTPEECQQYQQGVWRWLGGLGDQISREDPSSWDEARGWPPSFKGIINTMEVAHQDFTWRVRKHPRIVEVFAELYGTNELLSSFDSINVTRPGTNAKGGWLHVDQAPLKQGVQCIQGLVNLVDVGPDTTGTLMVKDKSHLHHHEFFQHHTCLSSEQKAHTEDFYIFQQQELPYWERLQSIGLKAKAGSLFLWDSRTAHQNSGPEATTDWRHVVYVCLQPRSLATQHDLQLKRQAYENYLITTHWPARNVTVFPPLGENYYKTTPSNEATSGRKDSKEAGGPDADVSVEGGEAQGNGRNASGSDSGTSGSSSGISGSSSAGSDPKSYWDERVADGTAQQVLTSLRNRQNVEDATLLKLAGVQEYDAGEVWHREPLLKLGV